MMRVSTIHGLAVEHSVETGCTHQEAVVEVCQEHRLAEIPEMPVAVFSSGEIMALSDSHDRERLRRHSELLDLGHQFAREYASRVRMREGL
jgi:hypothetical protein